MNTNNFRLSRLTHPRATLWAAILLAAVFLLFGLWAQFFAPGVDATSIAPDAHQATAWIGDLLQAAARL